MQLVVIVKRLNKRTAVPETLPEPLNIIGVVLEGFRFEGEEADPSEILNPNLGKWYKDRDGHYYWGGGLSIESETFEVPALAKSLEALAAQPALQFDATKMSWGHKFYEIPFIWDDLKTKGEGVTVAVIDTGVDVNHSDLISNIHPLSKSLVGPANDITDIDPNAHGTRMAGIIAGTGKNKIYGVAPESKLLVIKATEKKFAANVNKFIEAVNHVTSLSEVDIVSISYTLNDVPLFKQAIQKCIDAKKVVLAAIGNARDPDIPEDEDTFPSCYNSGINNTLGKETIAIGAFLFDGQKKLCSFSNNNHHLSFLAPGFAVLTANANNTVKNENGTSIATAFTAGCLALMISYCKKNNKPIDRCAEALLQTCDDMGPTIGHDLKSGFGFMNLRNAISKIK